MRIPACFKPFFWDVAIDELHLQKNKFFIIERLLNEGDHRTLYWLFNTYSHADIKYTVMKSRGLYEETALCWQSYFKIKKEEMRCFGRF